MGEGEAQRKNIKKRWQHPQNNDTDDAKEKNKKQKGNDEKTKL